MIFCFQVLVVLKDLHQILLRDLVVKAVAFWPLDQMAYLLHKDKLHHLLLVMLCSYKSRILLYEVQEVPSRQLLGSF